MGQGYTKYTSENEDPARILDFLPFQAASYLGFFLLFHLNLLIIPPGEPQKASENRVWELGEGEC